MHAAPPDTLRVPSSVRLPSLPPASVSGTRIVALATVRAAAALARIPVIGAAVFEAVPDKAWTDLDEVELRVIRLLDGVTPVAVLETMTGLPTDDLYGIIGSLLVRGLVVEGPIDAPPTTLRALVLPLAA